MSYKERNSYRGLDPDQKAIVDQLVNDLVGIKVQAIMLGQQAVKDTALVTLRALKRIIPSDYEAYRNAAYSLGSQQHAAARATASVNSNVALAQRLQQAELNAATARPAAPTEANLAAIQALLQANAAANAAALRARRGAVRALNTAPAPRPALVRAPVAAVPTAPAGYEKVATPANGDCLFHSVYYAWYPQQGTAVAAQKASADMIRQIIHDTVTVVDMLGFSSFLFQEAWQGGNTPEYTAALTKIQTTDTLLNAGIPGPQQLAARVVRLQVYKEFVTKQQYWGGNLELLILNKYALANGLPIIHVWNQRTRTYEHEDLALGNPTAPIHWNGEDHFSMLRRITPGGKRRTRRRHSKKKSTRKH